MEHTFACACGATVSGYLVQDSMSTASWEAEFAKVFSATMANAKREVRRAEAEQISVHGPTTTLSGPA